MDAAATPNESRLPGARRGAVYLDHAATTPVLPEALAVMTDALGRWANPSSPHTPGRAARALLEEARKRIAAALGWGGEIIFTSGASEAIALALSGREKDAVATSPVEHEAVLRLTRRVWRPEADALGRLDPARLGVIDGAIVAVQSANNETGVVQDMAALAYYIRAGGGIYFCDAAQSAGKVALPDADMIAISAHKFGGPPGVGALLVRNLAHLRAIGGQEKGYRPGTENLPAILAMATALEADRGWMEEAAALRDWLDAAIREEGGAIVGDGAERIATIASYAMPGVAAQAQLIQFDLKGIAVSSGSACSSGTLKTSHVLGAMKWPESAGGVVRVSFGRTTSRAEVEAFLVAWREIAAGAAR